MRLPHFGAGNLADLRQSGSEPALCVCLSCGVRGVPALCVRALALLVDTVLGLCRGGCMLRRGVSTTLCLGTRCATEGDTMTGHLLRAWRARRAQERVQHGDQQVWGPAVQRPGGDRDGAPARRGGAAWRPRRGRASCGSCKLRWEHHNKSMQMIRDILMVRRPCTPC